MSGAESVIASVLAEHRQVGYAGVSGHCSCGWDSEHPSERTVAEQWDAHVASAIEAALTPAWEDGAAPVVVHDEARMAPELVALLHDWDANSEDDNYSKGDAAVDLRAALHRACAACQIGALPHDRRCPTRLDRTPADDEQVLTDGQRAAVRCIRRIAARHNRRAETSMALLAIADRIESGADS